MSPEKALALITRWPTPRAMFEAVEEKRRTQKVILAKEAKEAELAEEQGTKKKRTAKRRKVEQFIAEELATGQSRDIKAAISTKIYNLFARKKYTD